MREKEGYRENLALLDAMFPDQGMLSQIEVARFLGVSPCTVRRNKQIKFNTVTGRITKADLARLVCL